MKKLLFLSALLIFACSDDEGNPCIYEPTLTTEAATDITETSATLNGVISIVSENCDVPNNTEQGFVYSTEIQPTLEDIQVNVNGTNISTTIEGLTPNTTYYVRAFLTNNFGDFYGDEVSFITSEVPCDVVYLDENGITIKACEDAYIGDVGIIDGVTYTVVDEAMLRAMVDNGLNITRIATTKVINMAEMFYVNETFNQNIGNWDLSNVTNINNMFYYATSFNQDISSWNVSSVTDMSYAFSCPDLYSEFNQDIASWNVSNVTNMRQMFWGADLFNQDISNWAVGNVTQCTDFSDNTPQWTLPQPNFTNCTP